jgi:hypothetical protein
MSRNRAPDLIDFILPANFAARLKGLPNSPMDEVAHGFEMRQSELLCYLSLLT